MFRYFTQNLIIYSVKIFLIISLINRNIIFCHCQNLAGNNEVFDDQVEYLLEDYLSEWDELTINRDTDCTRGQFCYSVTDKCCGYSSSSWGSLCRSGKSQSPINLPSCKSGGAASLGPPSPPLSLDGDLYKGKFSLTNAGHTVFLSFLDKKAVNISGAGAYILDHVRFHWGENDTSGGSEHCVKRVPGESCVREAMELQLVHYKASQNDFDSAIQSGQRNAVLVIALLLRIPSGKTAVQEDAAEINNPLLPVLSPVLKHLEEVTSFGDNSTIKNTFDLSGWFSVPNTVSSYFGSLTTPMCNQIVRWYVLQTPMPIKSQDITPFRSIRQPNGQPLVSNRRPMQKRNKRDVQCYQLKVKNIPATAEVRDPFIGL